MKIHVRDDEAYPVLHIDEFDSEYHKKGNLEVDENTLHRWRQAFAEFNLVQEEINRKLCQQYNYLDDRTWDGDSLPKSDYLILKNQDGSEWQLNQLENFDWDLIYKFVDSQQDVGGQPMKMVEVFSAIDWEFAKKYYYMVMKNPLPESSSP